MRTQSEIIKELNDAQNLCDKLAMAIGYDYAIYSLTNNTSLVEKINLNVTSFQNAERKLHSLKVELSKFV